MSTPAIAYTGPTVDSSVPFEVRRHLQLIFQKLGNHTQAFQLQQAKINAIKSGTSTTIEEGSSGGGSIIPFTPQPGIPINNQSGVTSYTTMSGDNGALIVLSDASPIAVSLTPQTPPFGVFICNQGAGTATLTPAAIGAVTPTISYTGNAGASSMPLLSGYGCLVGFDGSNWWALTMPIVPLSFSVISHEFLTSYDATTGEFSSSTIGFSDLTGIATTAQIGTGTPSAGEYVDGATGAWTALPVAALSGTTAAMGGSAMTVGQTITATATVTGATTAMVAACSPATYPGDGFVWDAYVSAANTVTARLTCVLADTPTSSAYNVRVIK